MALPRHAGGGETTFGGSQMATASEFVSVMAEEPPDSEAEAAHARARHHEQNPTSRVWRRPGASNGGSPAAAPAPSKATGSPQRRFSASTHASVDRSLMCADGETVRSSTMSSESASAAAAAAMAARGGADGTRAAVQTAAAAAAAVAAGARGVVDGTGALDWGLVRSATTTTEEVSRILMGAGALVLPKDS